MLRNPQLKSHYHAEFPDDEQVLLISEKDQVILSDRLQSLVMAEILRNPVSLDELIENLAARASMFEVCHAVMLLERSGYLTEASPDVAPEEAAFWNGMGFEVNALREALKRTPVELTALGMPLPEVFVKAFREIGIGFSEHAVLKVILTDDYRREELRTINHEALATGRPWMLVKPVGVEIWFGPLFSPRETGCWQCLKQRLDLNNPLNDLYRADKRVGEDIRVPPADLPHSLRIAADRTALEVVKWIYSHGSSALVGAIQTLDLRSFLSRSHVLIKRPQCNACGDTARDDRPRAIAIERRTDRCEVSTGGYREISFEDTLGKYMHHVSPVTGIVPVLKPYHPVEGAPIYNYSSGRNIALRSRTLFWLNQHIRSGNGGKGKTEIQAKVSALCEAVERYSLTYHGEETSITASLQELGLDGIHPNACMLYSDDQYRNRDSINLTYTKFYDLIPIPFDESRCMEWTQVYSLTEKKFKYLPSCFCYAQYPAEDDYHLFSYPDCNGAAAGNSPEEAILQGLLELVERDSVALWWYNMLRRPAVDLQSFNDPYFVQLLDHYESLHRRLYVLDLTSDVNIPVFAAISYRTDGGPQDIVFGFGAHLDAKIGLERAIVELNQILPIANVAEEQRAAGNYRTNDPDFLNWLKIATLENRQYLTPLEGGILKTAADYPGLCEPNVFEGIMCCQETLEKIGIEVLALDLTRPDVALPVFRVFAPGLRHFWKRLAPGRLYDVPVEMGWLKQPRKEEEMNSIAVFI